ncbi:MAG TPA: aldehyde dehydrogenase family protein [Polyangiaceae bacterium]|nr:aldehyde dehydrogenase family protein [Polyangiaceae bacterium]
MLGTLDTQFSGLRADSGSRETESVSPASGDAFNGIKTAIEWARLAQPEWSARSLDERYRLVAKAARAMLRDRATVLKLAKAEMGKHEVEGAFTEALGPLDTVRAWHRLVAECAVERVRLNPLGFPGKRAQIELVPRGVVGVIAPWNYPVAGLYRSVFPALLTGNTVIVKPSEQTPRTSAWFVDHLAELLPLGVAQVVQGGPAVGQALVESGIDACVFTGSVSAGGSVRRRCAELGIPASIEMGGKDAAIVLADCDLEQTAAGVTQWALSNSGQACGAIEVAYVQEEIADAFVASLTRAWSRLRTGPGAPDIEIHPLARAEQLAVVEEHVADALARGARLICGGKKTGEGLAYPPTLLDHCTPAMKVVREETFGPVLAVVRVRGAAEAERLVNASAYGLGASIWSRDVARAERVGSRLDVGVVTVNSHAFTGAVPGLAWSGTRATGYGVANSRWSLLTFCRPKTVAVDRSGRPDPYWMPFDAELGRLADALSEVQLGQLKNAWRIPGLLRRRARALKAFWRGR